MQDFAETTADLTESLDRDLAAVEGPAPPQLLAKHRYVLQMPLALSLDVDSGALRLESTLHANPGDRHLVELQLEIPVSAVDGLLMLLHSAAERLDLDALAGSDVSSSIARH